MVWVGVTWLLGDAFQTLVLLHWGALAHLLIAYPTGRLGISRGARRSPVGYVVSLPPSSCRGPAGRSASRSRCRCATLVRFTTASGTVRRGRAAPLAVAVAIGAVLCTAAVMSAASAPGLRAYARSRSAGSRRRPPDRPVVGARRSPASSWTSVAARPTGWSGERLARAIGDPSLIVGYVVEEGRPPVDEHGLPITLPEPGAGRAVTPVAAQRARAGGARSRFGVAGRSQAARRSRLRAERRGRHARLQAGLRSLMGEIEASTERLVDAARAQQRRLAAELWRPGGPAARGGWSVPAERRGRRSAPAADRAAPRADAFAQGLDPVALHAGGLAPALRALADARRAAGDALAGAPDDIRLRSRRAPGSCARRRSRTRSSTRTPRGSRSASPREATFSGSRSSTTARAAPNLRAARDCAASPSAWQRAAGFLRSRAARAAGTLLRADFERGTGA